MTKLAVVRAGSTTFLGEYGETDDQGILCLYNALPITQVNLPNPNTGQPMSVPVLGTTHWCVAEPIRRLLVAPEYFYSVDDQGKETARLFQEVYDKTIEALKVQSGEQLVQPVHSGGVSTLQELGLHVRPTPRG